MKYSVRDFAILMIALCTITVGISCTEQSNSLEDDAEFRSEIKQWDERRMANLKKPRGWPALVGLDWLQEGQTSFGCGADYDITVDADCDETLGTWFLIDDRLTFQPADQVKVTSHGKDFPGGAVASDADEDTDLFNYSSLYWMVIKRGNKYGVRLWDTLSANRSSLHAIPRFDIDHAYRLQASVIASDVQDSFTLENVLGMKLQYPVAGVVQASYQDTIFEIKALSGGEEELFLIFSDLTTGFETYDGGRYIYIPRPDSTGHTILDFNKAYNPPCAFTDYATCLLPPPENHVPMAIRAGEMDTGH